MHSRSVKVVLHYDPGTCIARVFSDNLITYSTLLTGSPDSGARLVGLDLMLEPEEWCCEACLSRITRTTRALWRLILR